MLHKWHLLWEGEMSLGVNIRSCWLPKLSRSLLDSTIILHVCSLGSTAEGVGDLDSVKYNHTANLACGVVADQAEKYGGGE